MSNARSSAFRVLRQPTLEEVKRQRSADGVGLRRSGSLRRSGDLPNRFVRSEPATPGSLVPDEESPLLVSRNVQSNSDSLEEPSTGTVIRFSDDTVPPADEADKAKPPGRIPLKQQLHHLWLILKSNYVSVLLILIPIAIASKLADWGNTAIFLLNFFAIVPLAWMMGKVTEEIAVHTGQVVGGLLNATFGNAVEMILAIQCLRERLVKVVQGSLLGSILSNLLLVLGMCFLFGGFKHKVQKFNKTGANTFGSLLLVACLGVMLPAAYHLTQEVVDPADTLQLSRFTAIIMSIMYACYLLFQLRTHTEYFEEEDEEEEPMLSLPVSIVLLALVTVAVAVCSEFLVGAIDGVKDQWGVSETFIGIILLPVVGNAAEHLTAVSCAMKNKMDLAIGVAVGSSTQIALLVLPVSVLLGWCMGVPMGLDFGGFETIVLVVTVLVTNAMTNDGETNWIEGAMLCASYVVIALACFWVKDSP